MAARCYSSKSSVSEVIVEATVIRCPTSKYLKPGADPVEHLGEIAHYYRNPLRRVMWRFKTWLQ